MPGSALRHAGVLLGGGRRQYKSRTYFVPCMVPCGRSRSASPRVTAMCAMEVDLRVKFAPLAHLHSPGSESPRYDPIINDMVFRFNSTLLSTREGKFGIPLGTAADRYRSIPLISLDHLCFAGSPYEADPVGQPNNMKSRSPSGNQKCLRNGS